MTVAVDLSIESPAWAAVPGLAELAERAVAAALAEAGTRVPARAEVSCLFTDDAAMRALNARWRGIDKPTNVLSFPAAGAGTFGGLLGDVALGFETVEREARRDDIPLPQHLFHLIVHGTLHLLGHDHVDDREAEAMERIETRVLMALGMADPHAGTNEDDAR